MLKLSIKDDLMKLWTNDILQQLQKSFCVSCFKGLDTEYIYAILDMSNSDLREEAEEIGIPVKLSNLSAKISFDREVPEEYILPFFNKDRQEIIIQKFDKLFNISFLMK